MLLTAFQAHVKLLAGVVHGRNWAAFWGGSGRGRGVGKQRFFLRGDLDLASEASVREELLLVVDGSTDDVVIDCSALSFIDSTGIRVLIDTQHALQKSGRSLRITNLADGPRRVFEILGLVAQLRVED